MTAPPPSTPPPPPPSRWAVWQLHVRRLARRLMRLPLTMMLTSLLAGLGIVQLSFQLVNTAYRSSTGSQQSAEARTHIQSLERDVQVLQDAEDNAVTPGYLRELARCQGFVGVGERVVVSPEAPASPGENCSVVRLP
ncbi:cell division protein FtsB [Deinococcus arenicola]|uniref:Cell division protein FtsB n=1 Tax=Deinococcus arenicola TaxID=2994950 RepID=A0ABU4DME2_9DEIO|nr:cell division protein FtsB [Deinococcus sp. ZS9-10]MDV6373117.1 cell division protein FtsB [Deinococcus sp. ZS9-10]